MISVHFQGKPFDFTVIQVYAPITNAKEAEVERFYGNLQDSLLSELPGNMQPNFRTTPTRTTFSLFA